MGDDEFRALVNAGPCVVMVAKSDMLRLLDVRDALRLERNQLRRGWLTTIQAENSCPATGGGCFAKRCGCVEEINLLIREACDD